jgi:hypothetical protein
MSAWRQVGDALHEAFTAALLLTGIIGGAERAVENAIDGLGPDLSAGALLVETARSAVVNAALEGFAQGEVVTIPSLPNLADWTANETARQAMIPKLSLSSQAARYGIAW